jgi:hypothetical protein
MGQGMQNEGVEHEDVTMRLLATSLTEDAQRWFNGLPDNHLATYENFVKLFKGRWLVKKDNKMLMIQFNHIKKKENDLKPG